MRKPFTGPIFTILALATILVSIFGASFAFAKGQSLSIAHTQFATSAKPATAPMASMHTVDMRNVPADSDSSAKLPARTMPLLTGVSPEVYAQRKAAALHNKNARLMRIPIKTRHTLQPLLSSLKVWLTQHLFVPILVAANHLTRH
jgi:hypothetical protein